MIFRKSTYTLFVTLLVASCAASHLLYTRPVGDAPFQGERYNVILYGLQSPHDVETVVILDRTDDAYQISPEAKYSYKVIENLSQAEAVKKAEQFLARLLLISKIEKRIISGRNGEVLGYEFRPIFPPEQLDNSRYHSVYTLKDNNKVLFRIYWQKFGEPLSDRGLE